MSARCTPPSRSTGLCALPSRPYHPEENGIEERSGGYVKSNALKGRRFDSLAALADYLDHWNRTIAQFRIHGTTRRQVIRHFLEVEQPLLKAVPRERFSLFEVGSRGGPNDGHVEVGAAFYSVPHPLVGATCACTGTSTSSASTPSPQTWRRLVAVHMRVHPGSWSTAPERRPLHQPARQEAYETNLLAQS